MCLISTVIIKDAVAYLLYKTEKEKVYSNKINYFQ